MEGVHMSPLDLCNCHHQYNSLTYWIDYSNSQLFLSKRTLFFSSFCFCLSSRVARRFSALIRCCSSFLRRSSNCCSLSCRAFSSFSSHWFFLAAMMGGTKHGEESKTLSKARWSNESSPSLSPPLSLSFVFDLKEMRVEKHLLIS